MPEKKKKFGKKLYTGIALVICCTLFIGVAQILFKKGMADFSLALSELVMNYYLIGGIALYAVGTVLLIFAFKLGELSTMFPFVSLSFVWVLLLSSLVLHEPVIVFDYIGVAFIIGGISMIGVGSR
ncbi:MAG: hypothetical protein V1743_02530 [Nanoarchaeota archaeon]